MTAKEQFKLLDLSNAFLFSLALSDPEICSMILETILEQPVGPVWVQPEKSILFSAQFRSVRLDVYASDGMYVEDSTDECVKMTRDETVARLHRRVTRLKEDRRWEAKYMKFEELLQEKLEQGIRRGVQQGRNEGIALARRVLRLSAQGKTAAEISALCGIAEAEVTEILSTDD